MAKKKTSVSTDPGGSILLNVPPGIDRLFVTDDNGNSIELDISSGQVLASAAHAAILQGSGYTPVS
jgi:hypothetical protein